MKKQKQIVVCIIMLLLFLIIIFLYISNKKSKYDINIPIKNYNLNDPKIEDEYLEYLKKSINPPKIRKFIENNFVPTSLLSNEKTGKEVIELMKEIGYEILFDSLFDKERIDFDDCPVTEKFKEKFNTNLFNYFNIKESDDCKVNCLIVYQEKILKVEVYGNFKNTEPTYWITHHFHYTLDDEGNVDDVIFNYTEE